MKMKKDFLNDSWTVNLMRSSSVGSQQGTVNSQFAGSSPACADGLIGHMYDVEGKQIEIPICQSCGSFMSMAMGTHALKWFCPCDYSGGNAGTPEGGSGAGFTTGNVGPVRVN